MLGEPSGRDRNLRAASLLEHGFQTYGWKLLFNTVTLDTLPRPADAKGIVSVRDSVIGWNCGKRNAQRPIARGKAKSRVKRRATAKKAHPKGQPAPKTAKAPARKPAEGTSASASAKTKHSAKATP